MSQFNPGSPPAPPKPAGIRFRIYIPDTITGVMATWPLRVKPATGGLLRRILVPMLTVWAWVARHLSRRVITIIRRSASLSVALPVNDYCFYRLHELIIVLRKKYHASACKINILYVILGSGWEGIVIRRSNWYFIKARLSGLYYIKYIIYLRQWWECGEISVKRPF